VSARDREIRDVEELFAAPTSPKVRAAFERLFADLRVLRDETRADGASFAVLILPFRFQVESQAPPPVAQATIAAFCQTEGIPVLDLLPAIQRLGSGAYWDYDHFSAMGARGVAEEILASGILSDRPGPPSGSAPAPSELLAALGLPAGDAQRPPGVGGWPLAPGPFPP
jgi:hypothetical protein